MTGITVTEIRLFQRLYGFIIKWRFSTVSALVIAHLVIIFTGSCQNNKVKQVDTMPGKVAYPELPQPAPVPVAESLRINLACQQWYDTVLRIKGFNGGMIVAKHGRILFEFYNGTGHIPGKDSITAETPLQIASVSKTFTAMAVLLMAQEGKLNIDDEFSKYFPAFNYPGVTIRTLLNHRSGLPNYTYFMENLGWNKTKIVTNQDVLDYLVNRKYELENIAPPNTHFSYCNTNYALLALLIEKLSGKKYGDYLQEVFFTPMGMKQTRVFNMKDSTLFLPSYDWKARLMNFGFLDEVYGDKNIYSTVRDLLTWDRYLSSGTVFTNQILEEAYIPYSNEKPGTRNYGLGWRMNIFPDGKKVIYHNGWWHGSNSCFIRLLHDSATIILIGNRFTRSIYHARILANLFGDYYVSVEDEDPEQLKPTDSIPAVKEMQKDSLSAPKNGMKKSGNKRR